jgi:hypothetical protein
MTSPFQKDITVMRSRHGPIAIERPHCMGNRDSAPHNNLLRIKPTCRRLGKAARRHRRGHSAARPPTASRARTQMRTAELADEVHTDLRSEEAMK